jgi:WD40 repeat protein
MAYSEGNAVSGLTANLARLWRGSTRLVTLCAVALIMSACNPEQNVYRTQTPRPEGTHGPFPTLLPMQWRNAGAEIVGDNGGRIELLGTLNWHSLSVFRLEFSPDSRLMISIDGGGTAVLWDLATGTTRFTIGVQDTVYAFFNADASEIIVVNADEKIFFVTAADGTLLSSLPANSGGVRSAAISADRTTLATAGFKGDVSIWNVATRALLRRITIGRDASILAVAFAPDGKSVAASTNDKAFYVWDVAAGQQLQAVSDLPNFVTRLIYAPDGSFLVAATTDTPFVYEIEPFRLRQSLIATNQFTDGGLSLSPDGNLLAIATKGENANVWEIATGKIQVSILQQQQATTSLAFAPNGSFLLNTIFNETSGSYIWLVSSFADNDPQVSGKNFNQSSSGISMGGWTPDGKRIILADGSGGMFVYGLPE